MSGVTLVVAGAEPEAPLHWHIVTETGSVRHSGQGDWWSVAENARGKIVLIVPGSSVSCHNVSITSKSERQAREAAPFAIEDFIASDLDLVHVSLQPLEKGASNAAQRVVMVVGLVDLEQWRSDASVAGLQLDSVVPDYWLLPSTEGQITRCEFHNRVLLRSVDWGAGLDGERADDLVSAITTSQGLEVFDPALSHEELLSSMAIRSGTIGPGLLSGAFAVNQRSGTGLNSLPWRSGIVAALSIVVLMIAQNIVVGNGLNEEAQRLREDAERQFRELYPEVGQVRNLRAQLREQSGASTGLQPEFLILSSALATAIGEDPTLDIDFIRFNAETGEMVSSVLYDDYEAFAAFRARVEAQGVLFDEGGSQQSGRRRAGSFSVSMRQ